MASAMNNFGMCSMLFRQCCCSHWKGFAQSNIANKTAVVLGVRYYRGSNRNTKKRERNLKARLRKREDTEQMVFDKREFFRQNFDREVFAFKSRLGLAFHDDNNLITALTHDSYKHDHDGDTTETTDQGLGNNAKFSLLGLSALSLYIADHLCTTYPSLPALGVRCLHDFLLGRSNIVRVSKQISLPDMIRLEHDLDNLHIERHLGYRQEDVICDIFYSLVGAIYIDQGSLEARRFVEDFVIAQLQGAELYKILQFQYPNKVLERIFMAQGKEKPIARVIQESGVTTPVPVYVVGVFCGDKMIAEASSHTMIKAKDEAMKAALMKHFQEGMLLPSSNERRFSEDRRR